MQVLYLVGILLMTFDLLTCTHSQGNCPLIYYVLIGQRIYYVSYYMYYSKVDTIEGSVEVGCKCGSYVSSRC